VQSAEGRVWGIGCRRENNAKKYGMRSEKVKVEAEAKVEVKVKAKVKRYSQKILEKNHENGSQLAGGICF
jgi:hypothetical protein